MTCHGVGYYTFNWQQQFPIYVISASLGIIQPHLISVPMGNFHNCRSICIYIYINTRRNDWAMEICLVNYMNHFSFPSCCRKCINSLSPIRYIKYLHLHLNNFAKISLEFSVQLHWGGCWLSPFNIGSGNKPLPETMMTQKYVAIWGY